MNSLLFLSLTTINKHNLFLRHFKSVSVQIFSSGSHTEREATGRTKGMYKDENLTLYRSKITSLLIEKNATERLTTCGYLDGKISIKTSLTATGRLFSRPLTKKEWQSMEAEGLQKILHC